MQSRTGEKEKLYFMIFFSVIIIDIHNKTLKKLQELTETRNMRKTFIIYVKKTVEEEGEERENVDDFGAEREPSHFFSLSSSFHRLLRKTRDYVFVNLIVCFSPSPSLSLGFFFFSFCDY